MRAVAWCSALLLAVLVAWLFLARSRFSPAAASTAGPSRGSSKGELDAQPALEASHASEVPRELASENGAATDAGSMTSEHTLTVRSSVDLPLPFIEWETSENGWLREELDDSRCDVASMKLPCRIRAPGHLASLASKAGQDIVLEPDALLVLEAAGLKTCTAQIRPYDRYIRQHEEEAYMRSELREAIAWGWISDDRWALAASSDLVPDAMGAADPIEIVLRWRDGRRADIHFTAKAGARGSWTVPCDQLFPSAPLDVHIERLDEGDEGSLQLLLGRISEGNADGRREEQPWGSVMFYAPQDFWLEETLPESRQELHVDFVPTGTPLSLAALDLRSRAYGRLVFVHDGTRRVLMLRRAFEVTGRLVSATNSDPISTADVSWHFTDGKNDLWGWQSAGRSLVLAADGGFRLRGPTDPPSSEQTPLDPPSQLVLHVAAPGFGEVERTFDTAGATAFDCGEIRLVPAQGEIVLAPGHGLSIKAVRWEGVMGSSAPGVWWSVRDALPTPDGRLALFLVRSDEHPELFQALENGQSTDRPWPTIPSERILIHVLLDGGDMPWAFERGPDGRYVAVRRGKYDLQAECRTLPGEEKGWMVGWQWHEIWDVVATVPAWKLGQRMALRFAAPTEGSTLYWSADGRPPRSGRDLGGSIPMNALPETLILQ